MIAEGFLYDGNDNELYLHSWRAFIYKYSVSFLWRWVKRCVKEIRARDLELMQVVCGEKNIKNPIQLLQVQVQTIPVQVIKKTFLKFGGSVVLSDSLPPLRSRVRDLGASNIWSHVGRVYCQHSAECHVGFIRFLRFPPTGKVDRVG